MKDIIAYLTFDGTCREAMTFYAKALGAEIHMMTFADMPEGPKNPKDASDRIMHARLAKGSAVLMASDTMPGMPLQAGSNFSISVDCEGAAEVDKLVAALGEGGKVTLPAQDMFWGAYFGMLTDKFGIQWMFNFDKPKG
jgi:PhnB protein